MKKRPRNILRRLLIGVLLAFVLVGVGIVSLVLFVGREPPEWYAPPDAEDEEVAALADKVEYRIVEELQRIRPSNKTWTLRIREHQVNAWLSARLPSWIAYEQGVEWPEQLGTPQMQLVEDGFLLALPFGTKLQKRVLVGHVVPSIDPGEGLALQLTGISIGRVSIPGDPIETLLQSIDEFLPARDRAEAGKVIGLLSGEQFIEPILELPDGRRVEILNLRCHEGAVDLTSLTLRDPRHQPTDPGAELQPIQEPSGSTDN